MKSPDPPSHVIAVKEIAHTELASKSNRLRPTGGRLESPLVRSTAGMSLLHRPDAGQPCVLVFIDRLPKRRVASPHLIGTIAIASTSIRYSGCARASTPIQEEAGGFLSPKVSTSTLATISASGPDRKFRM
jgi:hypothetical protein